MIGDLTKPLDAVTKTIGEAGQVADDLHLSGEERDQQLTKRLEIDMKSDSQLSKLIRPITLLVLLFFQGLIIVLSAVTEQGVDSVIVGQHGLLLVGAIGFYFNSKKIERAAERNIVGNIVAQRQQQKADREKEANEMKLERARQAHEFKLEKQRQNHELGEEKKTNRRKRRRNNEEPG